MIEVPQRGLTTVRREHRTSLTFRRVRDINKCSCSFPECCDTQLIDHSVFSEETADSIERSHVFDVYNEIAGKSTTIIVQLLMTKCEYLLFLCPISTFQ